MHFSHVVAPGDKNVGVIDVVVTAHRLVQAETGQKPCYRAGHAESGICFHIVGADAAFEQLGCRISIGNRPLSGPVYRHRIFSVVLDGLFHCRGHEIEGLLYGNLDQLTVFPDKGFFYSVPAVEDLDGIIAFGTGKSLIDAAIGIAFYGHCPTAGHTD